MLLMATTELEGAPRLCSPLPPATEEKQPPLEDDTLSCVLWHRSVGTHWRAMGFE